MFRHVCAKLVDRDGEWNVGNINVCLITRASQSYSDRPGCQIVQIANSIKPDGDNEWPYSPLNRSAWSQGNIPSLILRYSPILPTRLSRLEV